MSIGGKVTLLADNQVPVFTPTSEATGFEATHLTDGNETTIWKPTGFTTQTLTYDIGVPLISSFATSVFDVSATSPNGISYAPDGTLWIVDTATDKVYNITQTGTLISSFLTSIFDASATDTAGISYASDGTLWVCDVITNKIYNIELDGTLISSFATSVFDASAVAPKGITYALDGTLWICDVITNKIYNVELDGTLISSFATSVFDASAVAPNGVSYALDDTLWISDFFTDKIYNIETDGTLITSFATSVFDASAKQPAGISYAPDGTLWICDIVTDKIYNIKEMLAFDSLFLSGHNLNTVGAEILWQYSDNGSTWVDINYPFSPANDKSIGVRLDAMRTTRAVRVQLSSMTALPYIANLIITKQSEIDYAGLYDPHRTRIERTVNKTLHGQVSDVTEYYRERILTLTFATVNDPTYKKIKRYFDNHASDIIGVYWEPEFHQDDVWPMTLDSDELNAPFVVSGVTRSVTIQLRGVEE